MKSLFLLIGVVARAALASPIDVFVLHASDGSCRSDFIASDLADTLTRVAGFYASSSFGAFVPRFYAYDAAYPLACSTPPGALDLQVLRRTFSRGNVTIIAIPWGCGRYSGFTAQADISGSFVFLRIDPSLPADVPSVIAHEIGHTFGAFHAWANGVEYGDTTSVMGASTANLDSVDFSLYYKTAFGWISPGRVADGRWDTSSAYRGMTFQTSDLIRVYVDMRPTSAGKRYLVTTLLNPTVLPRYGDFGPTTLILDVTVVGNAIRHNVMGDSCSIRFDEEGVEVDSPIG